jgi:hypothetical protein
MQGVFKICARCNQRKELIARKLCWPCYMAARKLGELAKHPTEGGEVESLPSRESWEWKGDEQSLIDALERAEATTALLELKQKLLLNRHLTNAQKEQIADAPSAEKISEMVAAFSVKKRQFYSDADGFLHRVGE